VLTTRISGWKETGERLLLYPESIGKQANAIIADSDLPQTIAVLNILPEHELRAIRIWGAFSFFSAFGHLLTAIMGRSSLADSYGLTSEALLKTRMALFRLSQVLRYASTLDLIDYDASFQEFKDHYNPDLVEKTKVVALINIVRVQVRACGDPEMQSRLESKLERIEEEIRKTKPRWGTVIAGLFVLLGALADLKSLQPQLYSESYGVVSRIIQVLHEEGSVERSRGPHTLLTNPDGDHRPQGARDVAVLPPRRREEDELVTEPKELGPAVR
jgi:hypothetical protein